MSDDTSLSSESSYEPNEEESFSYNHDRRYAFSCIEQNAHDFERLDLCPYHPVLSVSEWLQLGNNIGSNTHLQSLSVCPDGVDEQDEIASTENLDLFINGIANNRSLKELLILEYDFSRARLGLLHPFVIENDSLVELQLNNCGFGLHDLQMLAAAFSQRRNPTSIKQIEISGSNISDESIPAIVEICGHCPRLQNLDLTYMHHYIGVQGLIHLATYLEDPRCSIQCLYLRGVTDDGARVLANSLVNNEKLKTLAVFGHSRITSIGWEYFHSILRSTSSINALLNCNHTLERLWEPRDSAPNDIPEDLLFCLQSNQIRRKTEVMRRKEVIRRKIFHYHLNSNENLSSIIGTDQDILHHILGWIGKDYNVYFRTESIIKSTAFYRIIRKFPDLCGFETLDRKMRRQLEVENATIKAENANLKAENNELRRKIEQLTIRK